MRRPRWREKRAAAAHSGRARSCAPRSTEIVELTLTGPLLCAHTIATSIAETWQAQPQPVEIVGSIDIGEHAWLHPRRPASLVDQDQLGSGKEGLERAFPSGHELARRREVLCRPSGAQRLRSPAHHWHHGTVARPIREHPQGGVGQKWEVAGNYERRAEVPGSPQCLTPGADGHQWPGTGGVLAYRRKPREAWPDLNNRGHDPLQRLSGAHCDRCAVDQDETLVEAHSPASAAGEHHARYPSHEEGPVSPAITSSAPCGAASLRYATPA